MDEQIKAREKVIMKTSVIGIITNVLLSLFKAMVGVFSHSIAVVLDALNNLSDALSSIVTIVGTKLANKPPDREHPMGHGRAEYLSAMLVAAIILYAGITAGVESVKKIFEPVEPDYNVLFLVVVAVAVVVKVLLGTYVSAKGKQVESKPLYDSGKDALFDAIVSGSVLVAAVIYLITGVSLEAYLGAVIAGFIIKAGVEMMIETVDDILGRRANAEETKRIKALLNEEPEVLGAYDLMLTNYGPGRNYGSVHLELPDTMTVEEVDVLTRRVETKIYHETGVILVAVGVYAYNTKNDEAAEMRNRIQEKVLSYDWALQLHGFFVDFEKKYIRFDVVMSFDINSREGVEILCKDLGEMYPEFAIYISPDADITD